MFKHIVFFKMKKEANKQTGIENAKELADKFQQISKEIPGVLSVELGFNCNHEKSFYELCLNQTFESEEALERYLVHPLHLQVRELVFDVIDHRIVVDYNV